MTLEFLVFFSMEIEVKISLDQQSYVKLLTCLGKETAIQYQENYFLDSDKELQKHFVNIRLRKENQDYYITSKRKGSLIDGISRINENQLQITQALFDDILTNPNSTTHPIIGDLLKEFNIQNLALVGSFKNKRMVYYWQGLCLEIDETTYAFGTCYEVEIETAEPELAKKKFLAFLNSNEIQFSNSTKSKYGRLLAGKI
jgi:uncharacterized protein YjbK